MGFFNFRKGNNKSTNNELDPQLQSDIDRFEKEFLTTVQRYISQPGASVNLKARHEVTREVIPFAVGFPEQFNPWRTVKSLADRRGIIYGLLDSQIGNQLNIWQVMERFNDDRYAERALQIASEHKQESDGQDPNYWNALAKTNFILTNYEAAEENCLTAMQLDSTNIRTKRIYADVLHVTNRQEKAHELYKEILAEKLPSDKEITLSIQELLGFDGDIINSPIYALGWLKSDKNVTPETWEWANEEFYYSPHFRSQYAFHLIENNEHMKGFVKLLSLSKEMPWFKDGVVNSYHLIDQLNLTASAQDEKTRLKELMDKNNWN
jgi:hypothetical protein